jgi:hypothetical protein
MTEGQPLNPTAMFLYDAKQFSVFFTCICYQNSICVHFSNNKGMSFLLPQDTRNKKKPSNNEKGAKGHNPHPSPH